MTLQKTQKHRPDTDKPGDRVTFLLFVVYLIVLFWILLFKLGVHFSYMENRSVNLIPFNQQLHSNGNVDGAEIILNIVVFVPIGIYAGILWEQAGFARKIFFIFLLSVFVEGLQYIMAVGAFDSTDLVTNTLGGLMGLLVFIAIEKAFNNRLKAQKFVNAFAAIGTAVMVLLLFLLKLDMLPIRYK